MMIHQRQSLEPSSPYSTSYRLIVQTKKYSPVMSALGLMDLFEALRIILKLIMVLSMLTNHSRKLKEPVGCQVKTTMGKSVE